MEAPSPRPLPREGLLGMGLPGGGSLGVGLKFINAVSVCTNHVDVCTNHVGVCTNHVGVCTNTDVVCRLSLPFLHLKYGQRQLFHGSFPATEGSTALYVHSLRRPNRLCQSPEKPRPHPTTHLSLHYSYPYLHQAPVHRQCRESRLSNSAHLNIGIRQARFPTQRGITGRMKLK